MTGLGGFTDDDARRTIWRALRLMAVAAVIGGLVLWWKSGWQSGVLFLTGAIISGSGLFEWLRLMSALMAGMGSEGDTPAVVRPMGPIMIGFFLRLAGAVAVLYVSLKYLNGSVYALIAGLALAVVALSIESLRLAKSWTS
jgi:hypothetical protein